MSAISNEELERQFDEGQDIVEYMDLATIKRPDRPTRRISMGIPAEMVIGLDRAAARIGVNRQAIIKEWPAERLDQEAEKERIRTMAG